MAEAEEGEEVQQQLHQHQTSTNQHHRLELKAARGKLYLAVFCNSPKNSSNNCTQTMKPDTVYVKALELQLCLDCLKAAHWASSCPRPG